jgi:DNA-binding response OmpR family regulator
MKLLVVEDDRETASYLLKELGESGYTVDRTEERWSSHSAHTAPAETNSDRIGPL